MRISICESFANKVVYCAMANATESSHQNVGDTTLVIHSKDGGSDAFLTFTKDELSAMWCTEEGKPKTVVCPSHLDLNGPVCRHSSGAYIFVSNRK